MKELGCGLPFAHWDYANGILDVANKMRCQASKVKLAVVGGAQGDKEPRASSVHLLTRVCAGQWIYKFNTEILAQRFTGRNVSARGQSDSKEMPGERVK